MATKKININVPALARVEGEGALEVEIEGGAIQRLQLRIYEPPRYFEKFLEGRAYHEVFDIVARICGICPVAYQMSAVQAIESIFKVEISPSQHAMRRAMYCGEWLQSHSLHIHMLAAPDFLGFTNIAEVAQAYPAVAHRGLRIQSLGNRLIKLFGARSVHPVGVRVGGFHHMPTADTIGALIHELEAVLPEAEELIQWTATLPLSDEEQDFTCVALRHDQEYAINHGRLFSNRGLDIDVTDIEQHLIEHQVPHSTALHALLDGKPYLVGPLARLNLNPDRLSPRAGQALAKTGIKLPSQNMFHSIVARAVEILITMEEAIRLLKNIDQKEPPHQSFDIQAGTGYACTEAPRGILWHRYDVDDNGIIKYARIVPPTSQNQARIEEDLHTSLNNFGLDQAADELRLQGEKVIRNYDPCISCATHFLKLDLKRDTAEQTTNLMEGDTGKLCILGIGSPTDLDRLGWQVIDYLQSQLSGAQDIQLIKLDRPGTQLLEYLQACSNVILIDAIESASAHAGPVHLKGEALSQVSRPLSSHGMGLAETLALSDSLKLAAGRVELFGLVIKPHQTIWPEQEVAHLGEAVIEHIQRQS